MEILRKKYIIAMPDGSRYSVPVSVIAENRAKNYAHEFDGDLTKSIIEDTAPLFANDNYEIEDWAKNNMNWVDVMGFATIVTTGTTDYQDGWCNGEVDIL